MTILQEWTLFQFYILMAILISANVLTVGFGCWYIWRQFRRGYPVKENKGCEVHHGTKATDTGNI